WPHITGEGGEWQDIAFSEYCTDPVPEWTGGTAVRQRMVRRGAHKLMVFDGYPDRFFDLDADPGERRDLSDDVAHGQTLAELRALAFGEWDPARIEKEMAERRARKDVLAAWARHTEPDSTHLWPIDPVMNRLDKAP
ncbi:MAG: sulfatase, partial [Pseudomonadota bacterium]